MHAYCLFCETQRCRIIAAYIRKSCGYCCFAPQIIQRKWVRGIPTEEKHDWLPGYVFLFTEEPITPRFEVDGIIRWIGQDELKGQDLAFAEGLYRQHGVLGSVHLVQLGARCSIADPGWEGMNGTVIRLDRGRKRCCVEFSFDGIPRRVWGGYDLISPAQPEA